MASASPTGVAVLGNTVHSADGVTSVMFSTYNGSSSWTDPTMVDRNCYQVPNQPLIYKSWTWPVATKNVAMSWTGWQTAGMDAHGIMSLTCPDPRQ